LGGRGRWISEFEASLIYRVSSRTTRTTQRNPVSKNQNQNQNQKQEKTNKTKTKQNKTKKPQVTAGTVKNVEKEEHSSFVGGIVRWYNHSGIQSDGSSQNWT
jgi:rare lipoprotein A (peptidoglycan hydrolase)